MNDILQRFPNQLYAQGALLRAHVAREGEAAGVITELADLNDVRDQLAASGVRFEFTADNNSQNDNIILPPQQEGKAPVAISAQIESAQEQAAQVAAGLKMQQPEMTALTTPEENAPASAVVANSANALNESQSVPR